MKIYRIICYKALTLKTDVKDIPVGREINQVPNQNCCSNQLPLQLQEYDSNWMFAMILRYLINYYWLERFLSCDVGKDETEDDEELLAQL